MSMYETLPNEQMNEAGKCVNGQTRAAIFRHIYLQRQRLASGELVLAASVTVNGKTLVVPAERVSSALRELHGDPVPNLRCTAQIEFDALPTYELTPHYRPS